MKRLKNIWFLLRWFLIGNYYCDTPKISKQVYWLLHKLLWFIILLCFALGLADICENLKLALIGMQNA